MPDLSLVHRGGPVMTDITERLRQWREVCEQATPGPWTFRDAEGDVVDRPTDGPPGIEIWPDGDKDGPFIAAARTAMPLLLDVADAAQRVRKARQAPLIERMDNDALFAGIAEHDAAMRALYDCLDALAVSQKEQQ